MITNIITAENEVEQKLRIGLIHILEMARAETTSEQDQRFQIQAICNMARECLEDWKKVRGE